MINDAISAEQSVEHSYYSIVRESLTSLLMAPPGHVLEIGCGTGKTLEYLKLNGASTVSGIELREEVALAASKNKHIDSIYNINFLDANSPIAGKKYDTIILSHVLEHFTEPTKVLSAVKAHMHHNSIFLVAVPNIRHLSVIIPLVLKGEFEYKESGILDHTHFKFFTKKSIVALLNKSGYETKNIKMDFAGPRAVMANRISLGLFEEFLGFAINISMTLKNN